MSPFTVDPLPVYWWVPVLLIVGGICIFFDLAPRKWLAWPRMIGGILVLLSVGWLAHDLTLALLS